MHGESVNVGAGRRERETSRKPKRTKTAGEWASARATTPKGRKVKGRRLTSSRGSSDRWSDQQQQHICTVAAAVKSQEKIKEARSTYRSVVRELRWKYRTLSQELVKMETGRPGRHQRWTVLCGELSGELEKDQNVFNT